MIILKYNKKQHKKIIHACVKALKQGNVVAYPTDTSYGLAVDATNPKAIKKLYKIKGRNFNKPSSLIVPSKEYSQRLVNWNLKSSKLAKAFWPGPLTVVLQLKMQNAEYRMLSGDSGFIGLRLPKNEIALDLAHQLKKPITATSANFAGEKDCYTAEEIVKQFKNKKLKPDIIISTGKLKKQMPSTIVKINDGYVEILRLGPISRIKIKKAIS
jgi:L-threonylcarbamoyladenylate synthase